MTYKINLARETTTTTGQGTVTLEGAPADWFTFLDAGAVSGRSYKVLIQEGNNRELVTGTYTDDEGSPATGTFSRDAVIQSLIGGVAGTDKIDIQAGATITVIAEAGDFVASEIDNDSDAPGTTMKDALERFPKGHLFGLGMANDVTDATNDIVIAAGECAAEGSDPVRMVLASALTKRLDAAWAVGTGNGGRDTGSIANGTWFVHLIMRSDTGVVDALFSASPSAPTMPSNYDYSRYIGAILRESAVIVPFIQDGDRFRRSVGIEDFNEAEVSTSAQLVALSVPAGEIVTAEFSVQLACDGLGNYSRALITAPDEADTAPGNSLASVISADEGTRGANAPRLEVRTNTSAQIRLRAQTNATTVRIRIWTWGWYDKRRRL